MDARIKQLGVAVVAAAALVVPAWGGAGHPATPLAGPSYTPKELEALKAFSAMTFAEKQAYLASLDTSRSAQSSVRP